MCPRSSVFVRHKTHALVAGLVWHPLISEDPLVREQGVYDFAQHYDTRMVVVHGDSQCLQLGYVPNQQLLKEHPMVLNFHSFAVEVRRLSDADVLLALVHMDTGEFPNHYAVALFEKSVLVLDMVSTGPEAHSIYNSYRSLFDPQVNFAVYTNDPEQFPAATVLDLQALMHTVHQKSLLRRPRKPRSSLRKRLGLRQWLTLGSLCLLLTGAGWWGGGFITGGQNKVDKAQQEEKDYLRAVQVGLPVLGFQHAGLDASFKSMGGIPLVLEGWQLTSVSCSATECLQTWRGESYWLPEELEALGKIKSEKTMGTQLEVVLRSGNQAALVGPGTLGDLPSRKAVSTLCKREIAFFKQVGVSIKCDTQGKPWPRKPSKLKPDAIVTEHLIETAVDPAELELLMQRIGSDVYWREISIRLLDSKAAGSKTGLVRYEMKGGLYAYR
jgi:hypothetical protein